MIVFLLLPGPTGFWTVPLGVEIAAGIVDLGVAVYLLVQVCRDSGRQGRSPVAWGVAMFLLGPVAFIVYVHKRRRALAAEGR